MTIQEFRDYMASGKPVIGGSDVHMMFHLLSQEALKITAEINGTYHTPEELHALLEQLWGREVPRTVGLFPPFHTDCGKNTVVGERVFINMGCKFQDQGGITIDEGALIGHNVVLARRNMDNIGHTAHFWGAVYGLLFPLAIRPDIFHHFLAQLGL